MKFKKFRYNLITIGLVAIVGCAVALPLFAAQNAETGFGETEFEEEFIDNDIEEYEVDPVEDEEYEEEEDDKFASFNPLDWIKHSLDLLYNGKGYESTFTQTIINKTSVASSTITIPQKAKGTIKRSGNNSLEEGYYWSTYDGIKSDQLKNFYQYFYIDKDNETLYRGETGSYNKDKKTYDMEKGVVETYTYQEGIDKYLVLFGDSFQLTPTKEDIYDYKEEDNTITIYTDYKLKNIPNTIKKFYGTTGQLKDINYTSLSITYVIDTKTGKMKSITRTETLTATSMGFPVTSSATTTQTFKKVDVTVDLSQPK